MDFFAPPAFAEDLRLAGIGLVTVNVTAEVATVCAQEQVSVRVQLEIDGSAGGAASTHAESEGGSGTAQKMKRETKDPSHVFNKLRRLIP